VRSGDRVTIRHRLGRYDVEVRSGAITDLPRYLQELAPGHRPAVITDRTVARHVAPPVDGPTLIVPPGERSKSRARWLDLTDRLLDLGFGRRSVLVAVGGGVVGDLTGFVAATFSRGIPYLQVPTSLLAMVDAAIGGKTGVNTAHGKNLVGAFHPPIGVVIDPSVLATLPDQELRNGLVEAVKHGLVADAEYFAWIDAHRAALLAREPGALATLIRRSVAIKAAIVASDERDTGRRAALNAGHTIGHALEAASRFRVRHGEATAIGLVAEAGLAERRGLVPKGLARDLVRRFRDLGLRLRVPAIPDRAVLAAVGHDKKAGGGAIGCALPRAPGALARVAEPVVPVDEASVRQAWRAARALLG
jgi:3-dehydroquinate synthase